MIIVGVPMPPFARRTFSRSFKNGHSKARTSSRVFGSGMVLSGGFIAVTPLRG